MGDVMKQGAFTEFSWGIVLWLFRGFCIAWTAVVVLLAARAFAMFLQ